MRAKPLEIATLTVASLLALAAFLWPFVTPALSVSLQQATPVLAIAAATVLVAITLVALNRELAGARTVALLGTLTALGMVLRFLGFGFGGVEPVFVLFIIAGRALGASFGFSLGVSVMLASSLLWGGVGPWLPFQMFAAGWVGLGAGLLPGRKSPNRGWREIGLLALYGVIASYLFGLLMNSWYWPFAVGGATSISFDATVSVAENIARFLTYSLVTSTLTWDTVRAITTVVGLTVLGHPLLIALHRVRR